MNTVSEQKNTGYAGVEEIGRRLAGKYLTFMIDKEEFAIEILTVNQIIHLQKITVVPNTPEFVRGIINLRGTIIPIIDLRRKLAMNMCADTVHSCIVVIQLEGETGKVDMGIVIDEVKEVIEIQAEDIDPTPEFGTGTDVPFLMGVAKTGKNVKMLLDIGKVLSAEELGTVSRLSKT